MSAHHFLLHASAGADLFEDACMWTLAGIKPQFPEFTESGQRGELRRRLKLAETGGTMIGVGSGRRTGLTLQFP